MAKLISEGTIELDRGVSVYSCAAAVGKNGERRTSRQLL